MSQNPDQKRKLAVASAGAIMANNGLVRKSEMPSNKKPIIDLSVASSSRCTKQVENPELKRKLDVGSIGAIAKGPLPKLARKKQVENPELKRKLDVGSIGAIAKGTLPKLARKSEIPCINAINNEFSTRMVISENQNESIHPCVATPSRPCNEQKQLNTATLNQILDIFPGIDRNLVINEYSKCADAASLVNYLSELSDYPKSSEMPIPNPYYFEQLQCLLNVFPDADKSFLAEKSLLNKIEFEKFVHETLQNNMYPRRKAYKKELKGRVDENDVGLYTTSFSIKSFLQIIPDPFNYYMDEKRGSSHSTHGWQFLKKRYINYYVKDVMEVYRNQNFNLSLTCDYCDTNPPKKLKKRPTNNCELWMPDSVNIPFLKEACFIEHKAEIKAYLDEEAEAKERAFREAKEKGELIECGCCYVKITFNNCVPCENADLFCLTCVQKSAEIRIGEGLTDFPCLSDCGSQFSLQLLKNLLKPRLFSKLLKQIQIREVKAANIEGLEDCPFCEFATIPPPETKVFTCLNPDCLKESCRQCHRPSHIPLRCEEVETDAQTEARKFVEDEMTRALVRECYRCKKPFIKTDGCNKMTCSCGAMMCYVCRQPVSDYGHFNGQGGSELKKCPLYTTDKLLHVDAVKARAEQALKKLDVNLVHDPSKILPDATKAKTCLPVGIVQNDRLVLQRAVGPAIQPRKLQNNAGKGHAQP